ncbi:DgyrCDS1774 [Dimorphilus gyrociliatus]|uniref:DgyrCDS1774 n=1 Tax=Dimorphilus gyrociliatus TaxID=2664684 RepID=A0A7I8VDG7_9ANNE|nr:DgyrCDS1774 [Dimorphilus gyrociliatus]
MNSFIIIFVKIYGIFANTTLKEEFMSYNLFNKFTAELIDKLNIGEGQDSKSFEVENVQKFVNFNYDNQGSLICYPNYGLCDLKDSFANYAVIKLDENEYITPILAEYQFLNDYDKLEYIQDSNGPFVLIPKYVNKSQTYTKSAIFYFDASDLTSGKYAFYNLKLYILVESSSNVGEKICTNDKLEDGIIKFWINELYNRPEIDRRGICLKPIISCKRRCNYGEKLDENVKDYCLPCPKGFYKDGMTMIFSEDCFPCPPYTYQDVQGSEKCKPCLNVNSSNIPLIGSTTKEECYFTLFDINNIADNNFTTIYYAEIDGEHR